MEVGAAAAGASDADVTGDGDIVGAAVDGVAAGPGAFDPELHPVRATSITTTIERIIIKLPCGSASRRPGW
jgi:hypothetical protein